MLLFPVINTFESSANSIGSISDDTFGSKNSSGPNIDPCGTPHVTSSVDETLPRHEASIRSVLEYACQVWSTSLTEQQCDLQCDLWPSPSRGGGWWSYNRPCTTRKHLQKLRLQHSTFANSSCASASLLSSSETPTNSTIYMYCPRKERWHMG